MTFWEPSFWETGFWADGSWEGMADEAAHTIAPIDRLLFDSPELRTITDE